jgi:hypothetical protein
MMFMSPMAAPSRVIRPIRDAARVTVPSWLINRFAILSLRVISKEDSSPILT